MKIVDIADKKAKEIVMEYLSKGKVAVLPTDTIYGLSALATSVKSIKKINQIKKRSSLKPQIVLVSSIAMAKKYCYISNGQIQYLKKIWPGKTTVILKSKDVLPKILTGEQNTLAVRYPKNIFLKNIIDELGGPITSTSLNISGQETVKDLAMIDKIFKTKKPDLAVKKNVQKNFRPSKIVDITNINKIKIIRN